MGPKAARKLAVEGVLMLVASVLCVFIDWRMGGPVIFGVLIGSKFLTTGCALLVQGIAAMSEQRAH